MLFGRYDQDQRMPPSSQKYILPFGPSAIGMSKRHDKPVPEVSRSSPMHKISSKLDWTRMLGFEQIADSRSAAQDSSAKLGLKVGSKIGSKPGLKT
jgi:hypothetical protein